MKRLLVLTITAALAGCAAEVADPTDDAEIVAQVEALGFAGYDIEVDGNVIHVDGDITLFRDKLRDGAYASFAPPVADADGGLIEKGYNRAVVTNGVNNIKLVWGTGTQYPTDAIRNAFINAAGDFNSTAGSALRLSQNNTGPTVRVKMMTAYWPLGTTCKPAEVACAEWPIDGKPGATIYIKSSPNAECPNWTTSWLALAARHELMHTFGMTHPLEGAHIKDTAPCAAGDTDCTEFPNYPTLMGKTPKRGNGPCEATPIVLQTDDKASMAKIY